MRVKGGDEIYIKEIRKHLKVSSNEFAAMIGTTRQSLWNKEQGTTPWSLPELIRIKEIMQQNDIDEHLTVSCGGEKWSLHIGKEAE